MLRGIYGNKMDEIVGGWRKPHNEEFYNLYLSPSIILCTGARALGFDG
jgi:hypothetical protein